MANRSLFQSLIGRFLPPTDSTNFAGGSAYALPAEQALAQLAATGCLHSTFYAAEGATAENQLAAVLALAAEVEPTFIAQLAVYARERGAMKDMPALLCAVLASRDGALLERIFERVIDSSRMLRSFVQIVRSGVTGRKSLGSRPKRLVLAWLASRSDEQIFFASVGNDPSLADILRMVHPTPATASREALYGYILGRPYNAEALPEIVRDYEQFKRSLGSPN
jgi:60 kDa SS-A/Ro ribonucleoprotein